jgi:hypothetical protein
MRISETWSLQLTRNEALEAYCSDCGMDYSCDTD